MPAEENYFAALKTVIGSGNGYFFEGGKKEDRTNDG
jgi:hypothetical protein